MAECRAPQLLPCLAYGESRVWTEVEWESGRRSAEEFAHAALVLPYCPEGDLMSRLEDGERAPSEDEMRRWTMQILEALRVLHRAGWVHRDVKPENVLLHNGNALLADFGLACRAADDERAQQPSGTLMYMAPEIAQTFSGYDLDSERLWALYRKHRLDELAKRNAIRRGACFASDVFSLGLTMFAMLCRQGVCEDYGN